MGFFSAQDVIQHDFQRPGLKQICGTLTSNGNETKRQASDMWTQQRSDTQPSAPRSCHSFAFRFGVHVVLSFRWGSAHLSCHTVQPSDSRAARLCTLNLKPLEVQRWRTKTWRGK